MGIIYKVTSPSGKIYIGQTVKTLAGRRGDHFSYVKRNPDCKNKFANALRKYQNRLRWEILYDSVLCEDLDDMEISAIALYDSYKYGYNGTIGGEGSVGRKVSDITRKKISRSHIGKKVSNETKSKISKAHSGKPKPKSNKHCINISAGKAGQASGEQNPKAKLNKDTAHNIRLLRLSGMEIKHIAKKFNVSEATIAGIIMNRRWKDDKYIVPKTKNWKNQTKLTVEQVRGIRKQFKLGIPIYKLAKKYHITRGSISNIIHKRTWSNI